MLERKEIEEILDKKVRPSLAMDGGNIELVDVKENKVYVKLLGACGHCPGAAMTLKHGVEQVLRQEFPDLEALIAV